MKLRQGASCLGLGLAAFASTIVAGLPLEASANTPAIAQERVRSAIRRVLGGAHTSAAAMARMLKDATEAIKAQLAEGSGLFAPEFAAFAKTTDNKTAAFFRSQAFQCGEMRIKEGEDTTTLVGRASQCLTDAVTSTRAAATVHRLRYVVRILANVALKGATQLKAALPAIHKYMPAGVPEAELYPAELKATLIASSELDARSFGQRAIGCSALRTTAGETAHDFAKRLSDCMAKASRANKREPIDTVIARAVDRLLETALGGTRSLRSGIDQALGLLDERIDSAAAFPTVLRSDLADAGPLVATYFIRGARRCRRMVRGPNQPPASFVKQMGQCLTGAVGEVSPISLVQLTLTAVRTVVKGAGEGIAALRTALKEADNMLHGKIAPRQVVGGDVRNQIAFGKAEWLKRFAQLAPVCQNREFKKNHRFDEFLIRVNLCLSSASSGLTAERLEARIRESVRRVAASGSRGARTLRDTVRSEIIELEKIMRVADLYPDPWRVSIRELMDASARAFATLGAKCSKTARGTGEGLGQYVKRLAACLEDSRLQSGGDALARRVRESVMSLVFAAQTSAGTLRSAIGPAVAVLGGYVHPTLLYSAPLREAISVASDELAIVFARDGRRCVEIQRQGSINLFAQQVSNCLVAITRGSMDKARQGAVAEAVTELLALVDRGPTALLSGYTPLWSKIQGHLNLGGTFAQALFFEARTQAFSTYARGRCQAMPAASPAQVGHLRACLLQGRAAAERILPPDACRGRTASALAECCLEGQNRLLGSCAQHRFACRTGEVFQNGVCIAGGPGGGVTCPPGSQSSGTGACVGSPCPLGTVRGITGHCTIATCSQGGVLDTLGRCVQTYCPPGSALNPFNQCASACGARLVPGPAGGCVAATCPYGASQDMYGRCQTILCPDGQTMNGYRQCIAAVGVGLVGAPFGTPGPYSQPGLYSQPGVVQPGLYSQPGVVQPGLYSQPGGYTQPGGCAVGFVMGTGGYCVRNFCPPGTVLNGLGQCSQGACPYGFVLTPTGQCAR